MTRDFPHPFYLIRLVWALVEFFICAPFVLSSAVWRWLKER